MPVTALPSILRTSPTFRTEVDTFFETQLPTFTTEVNALQADVNAKQATASTAATTATTKAGEASTSASAALASQNSATTSASTATTKAGEALSSANSASASASTATTKAAEAAASAASVVRDGLGGVAGLSPTGAINLINTGSSVSALRNNNTVATTYTLPTDVGGTLALTSDITGGAKAGSFTTLTASGAATFPAGATVTGAALIGYNIGAGGTVTQATSKSTAVTLNKPCGVITMNNAALASGAGVIFALNNSLISITDTVVCHHDGTAGTANAYVVQTLTTGVGSVAIRVVNISAGSLSEPLTLTFSTVKVVAA